MKGGLLLLGFALLAAAPSGAAPDACALPGELLLAGGSGLGGTGREEAGGLGGTGRGEDSGLGGTGRGEDSGLGGTGRSGDSGMGGTGVLGTVTGFGSLCVNGLRVGYDAGATVVLRDGPGSVADLAVGQVVWLVAEERDAGLFTDRIEIVSAVLGRVAGIDVSARRMVVSGRVVELPEGIPIVTEGGEDSDEAELEPGDFLDVAALSGADGRFVASRIVRHTTAPQGRARLAEVRRELLAGRGFARVSVEGYARPDARPDRLGLSGIAVAVPEAARARASRDARLVVEGRLGDRAVRAERLRLTGAHRPDERGERPGPTVLPAPRAPETPTSLPTPRAPEKPTGLEPRGPEKPEGTPERGPVERPDSTPSRPTENKPEARPERPERVERIERPERPERPDVERTERFERPDRVDRPPTQDLIAPRDLR